MIQTARSALCLRFASNQVRRFATQQRVIQHLDSRTLLQVSGQDSSEFLQGLITNDMKHLEEGNASIYALLLNIKGRVLFDTIIYKHQEKQTFFIECDFEVADTLKKHLSMYKLRKKVDVKPLNEDMKVWTVFDPIAAPEAAFSKSDSKLEGQIFPCGAQYNKSFKIIDKMFVYEDPRLAELGLRVLAESSRDCEGIMRDLGLKDNQLSESVNYRSHRIKLGVGEGVGDFPPGKALPLEINADYLRGINFHKGCYIGQELTARTHHTGVVRKRIMPLVFEGVPERKYEYDERIVDGEGKPVGKFRAQEDKFGLGLMRIVEAMKGNLSIGGQRLRAVKPSWWMPEFQKEPLLSATSSE